MTVDIEDEKRIFWEDEEWLNNVEEIPKGWGFSSEEEGMKSSESSDWEPDFTSYNGKLSTYFTRPRRIWFYLLCDIKP